MNTNDIKELLERYANNQCTALEVAYVESWYSELSKYTHETPAETVERDTAISHHNVLDHIKKQAKIIALPNRFTSIAAAAILVMLGMGMFIYYSHSLDTNSYANDIKPGSDQAILTLANGKKINLSNAGNGNLAVQAGVQIIKTNAGQLTFQITNLDESSGDYIVETPRGGQFQIVLPDGTKVWLNAASSLKLPSTYVSQKQRKVELSGEAYFEVTKDKSHPFVVVTASQEVTVLGTHFDVNAYDDEVDTKTTLLEGSVKVLALDGSQTEKTALLKPGEQSVLNQQSLKTVAVNAEQIVAWKNGFFQFYRADIKTVMRQLARWYDVQVVFEGNLPKKEFTGEIYRDLTASQALNLLNYFNVNFKIEGKVITVIGKKGV
ncbi:FecR family protein [Pedobacter metabolipauper]|uniref:FecR family protein n=1 Tax=Pedobacter metabolipauper TaxID=425513 RepID=A0A4R6SWP4_9SPHI|nr:FecR family protein [Pedobacter metabolipauper]TDQ10270.1 FecR family protein [Pedobacter metabolipauper]